MNKVLISAVSVCLFATAEETEAIAVGGVGEAVVETVEGPVNAGELFVRGDVTGDGLVDISDGFRVVTYLFAGGDEPACMVAADTNNDGRIDLTDTLVFFRYLYLGGEKPFMPYPGCGQDPTPDAFGCERSFCSLEGDEPPPTEN